MAWGCGGSRCEAMEAWWRRCEARDGGTVARGTGLRWHKERAARSGPLFLYGSGSGLLLLLPGWIRWRAAKSGGGWLDPWQGRPRRWIEDRRASQQWIQRRGGGSGKQRWRRPMDGLGGPMDGLAGLIHVFFLFYLIYRGGQQTASENVTLTVTFDPRRLEKPPR